MNPQPVAWMHADGRIMNVSQLAGAASAVRDSWKNATPLYAGSAPSAPCVVEPPMAWLVKTKSGKRKLTFVSSNVEGWKKDRTAAGHTLIPLYERSKP